MSPDACTYYGREWGVLVIIHPVPNLKQAVDFAGLSIDVDVEVARRSGQTRNCLDVGSKSIAIYVMSVSLPKEEKAPQEKQKPPSFLFHFGWENRREEGGGRHDRFNSQVPGTGCHPHIANRHREASRRTLQLGIMRQRVLRLSNTDW